MMKNKVKAYFNKIISFTKNGFLHMFSANVLNKILSMGSNMIITRLLTKSDFGVLSYVLNIYAYFGMITGFGLLSGALQFGTENKGTEKEYSIFRYALQKGTIIDGFLILTGYIGLYIFSLPFAGAKVLLYLYLPMLILEYIANLLLVILRSENRIKEYARLLNLNTVLIVLGTCLGAIFGLYGVIVGKYIGQIATIVFIVIYMKGDISKLKIGFESIQRDLKSLWKYSIATGIASFLNCLLYLLDISMIAVLLSDDETVATYKVATMIPNALQFVPSSFIICILPNIIANNKNSQWLRKHVKNYFFGMAAINAFVAIAFIIGASIIITVFSGSQYLDAVPSFRLLVLGYAVAGTFRSMSTNILAALRKVKFNIVISVISGVLDIILNYILITNYKMNGAALATLSTEIISSIIAFTVLAYTLLNYEKVKNV